MSIRCIRPFIVGAIASAGLVLSHAQGMEPQPTPPKELGAWPLNPEHDRAIFCGLPGTETSASYAGALAREIRALASRGQSTRQALDTIRERARCDDLLKGQAS